VINKHCCANCHRDVVVQQNIIVIIVMPGQVLGNSNVGVLDALEILRYIVGLDSIINECHSAFNAARITGGETPTVHDAIQILRHSVGLPNMIG
jgi:hypothetical protein